MFVFGLVVDGFVCYGSVLALPALLSLGEEKSRVSKTNNTCLQLMRTNTLAALF